MANNYNVKVNIPQYVPKNAPPALIDCVDCKKYKELKREIKEANISKIEKQFLLAAATRHYCFKYDKIADYYVSASKEMQELMEKSALVIIDFDDAIAYGYAKLNSRMSEIIDKRIGENNA